MNILFNNQLTLGVGLKDEATFANYFSDFSSGKNLQLVEELKKSARGSGERVIYFYGSGGEGCTHLLQACCHEANQHKRKSVYLPLAHFIDFSPEIFEGLESLDLVCIDDVHKIAGKSEWEEALFHAYNRIRDNNGHLIVTSNAAPKVLGLALPDIASRLSWGVVFQLQPLSDQEKLSVLIMRAERRGMTLSEEVGKFILTHCPRHMSTLFAALDALDNISLAAQRKLTIPFVKMVLQI
jgi:DnaA family protein